jgi:glycine cleavage system H protein
VSGVETLYYKRSRFSTRLPVDRRYTAGHYWLREENPGLWRVGFTKFATRMLGDLVEYEFSIPVGAQIVVGQEIGSIEGFKALTTLYSVADGEFLGLGDGFGTDITTAESDPYGRGWLYRVKGQPDPASLDVQGYMALLDATIDKLLDSRHTTGSSGETDDGHDER